MNLNIINISVYHLEQQGVLLRQIPVENLPTGVVSYKPPLGLTS